MHEPSKCVRGLAPTLLGSEFERMDYFALDRSFARADLALYFKAPRPDRRVMKCKW